MHWATGLRDGVYALGFAILLVWVLYIGRPLILPLLTAVIVVYVLVEAAQAVRAFPPAARLPQWLVTLAVALVLGIGVAVMLMILADNVARVVAALPRYEDNIVALMTRFAGWLGISGEPGWARLRQITLDSIDMRSLAVTVLNSLRGLGSSIFLILLYSAFILIERRAFADKLGRIIQDPETRASTFAVLARVNERIGRYLAVKTLVNVILGVLSYPVMVALGIEFAAFWAVLIGLMNYVPYIGSVVGVAFPVLLTLAQTGSLWSAGIAMGALTVIQVIVGSAIEPPLMGRAFNLSPLVVLVSVAFWALIWGIPGAILAVPLTASVIIVLGEFTATRPVAILLSAESVLPSRRRR
ncbi:AI-2E family transporter [Paracoccus sp. S-4012]|uniref:AI-2E family transporter n=1 Tax=Paracoccus sp. S-4012 TaxID=2665648 RepID=UPI0012AFD292|nr:AI-2E family transporter [Paracoccus sp. S-4012]MRX50539.1 AI-2E family transporter [Paracoccus sp. S-4012]